MEEILGSRMPLQTRSIIIFTHFLFSILTKDGSRALMELYTIRKIVAEHGTVLKWDRKRRNLLMLSLFQKALDGLEAQKKSYTELWMEGGIGDLYLFQFRAKAGI